MTDISSLTPVGLALPEAEDTTFLSNGRWLVIDTTDSAVGYEYTKAACPDWCRDCGRGGQDFTVTEADYLPKQEDTEMRYECECGATRTVLALADKGTPTFNSFAPDWEYELQARDDHTEDLGAVAPFYVLNHEFSIYDDGGLDDCLGVLAGPFPTARFALFAYDHWKDLGLDGKVSIKRRDELSLADCKICSKTLVPERASKAVNGNGEVSSYMCGACFRQEFKPLFQVLMGDEEADSLFPDE